MKYYIYIAAILFVFTISSCGPNIVYEQEHVLGKSWTYDESAEFAFKISEIIGPEKDIPAPDVYTTGRETVSYTHLTLPTIYSV